MSYILISIEQKPSKINNSTIYVITWFDEDTLDQYETIIDDSYRNFKRNGWQEILNSTHPYGRYNGLKQAMRKTQRGVKVLDADSVPYKTETLSVDEIIDIMNKRKGNGRNTFRDLFDF